MVWGYTYEKHIVCRIADPVFDYVSIRIYSFSYIFTTLSEPYFINETLRLDCEHSSSCYHHKFDTTYRQDKYVECSFDI